MEGFDISQGNLHAQFLRDKYNKYDLKCDVLFPDGTIVKNCTIHLRSGANILLRITFHGVEFQDWVGFGIDRFKDLKYKILDKKPV